MLISVPYFLILNNWSDLIRWRSFIKATQPKATIVATNGCFDILHAGHIAMLEEAKALGDYLVVGINSDASVRHLKGNTRPINSQDNRKKVLEALRCVDFVHIFPDVRANVFLNVCSPHIYVKAGDYNLSNLDKTEKEVLEKHNTIVKFSPYIKGLSTTNILKSI